MLGITRYNAPFFHSGSLKPMFTLQHNHPLINRTTFALPATAAHYIELTDSADLPALCQLPEYNRRTVCWLGGGSNTLFTRDYSALVVHIATRGIRETHRAGGIVHMEAQAGEILHDFIQHTLALGLSGLENLSLIPGTVGACPVQNVGAYGVEVKDRIVSVQCFDLETQNFITLTNAQCQFGYRESLFKQQGKRRYVITAVTFALDETFTPKTHYGDLAATLVAQHGSQAPTAAQVAQAIIRIRRSKLPDPAELGNAGSFYKNPVITAEHAARIQQQYPAMPSYPQADGSLKLAAGWLIDQCGLKGKQIGGAAVHEHQALVLVNKNHASAQDVQDLSDYVCQAVWEKFHIRLEPEPNLEPHWDEQPVQHPCAGDSNS